MKSKEQLLKEANDLIRSFSSIIDRRGEAVNWEGISKAVKTSLADQHEALFVKNCDATDVKPRVVCYCGSLRFKALFEKFEYESVLKGEIALLPCCMFVDIEREYGALSEYKQKADEQHKRKIDICDEVFVINENGYIGKSTKIEIDYALRIGKPVRYMETKKSENEKLN